MQNWIVLKFSQIFVAVHWGTSCLTFGYRFGDALHRKTCPHLSLRTPLGRRGPGIRCSRYASVEIATWNVQTWNTLHKTGILYLGKRKIIDSKVSSKGILMKVTPWKIDMEPTNHPIFARKNDLNQTSNFGHGTQPFIFPPGWAQISPEPGSHGRGKRRMPSVQMTWRIIPVEELPWEPTVSFIFRGYGWL